MITNSGLYTSVPDILQVRVDSPNGPNLTGATFTGPTGCDPIMSNPYAHVDFCPVPAIPVGSSWSISYSVAIPTASYFRIRAEKIDDNERSGVIAYHKFQTQNGLPLVLAWNPDHPLPSSPPGFAFGQSHPFTVNITNPNTTSKSFSLEVSIPEGGYVCNLSGPAGCTLTTNPATYSPGDSIDRIARCPVTLAAGATSSLFFSANFPDYDYDPPQNGQNCGTTVRNIQVKARVIGVVARPISWRIKVNQ